MPKFEITKEGDSLSHAYVTVGFEAHICYWFSGINESKDILGNDIQPGSLYVESKRLVVETWNLMVTWKSVSSLS